MIEKGKGNVQKEKNPACRKSKLKMHSGGNEK
jgi:hypothetical protein